MLLDEILLNLNMVLFGGKGGVGKTTCASSSAIWAAEQGRNTLIISTDPAHSLGDSLGVSLPPGIPTAVPGIANLTALEINSQANITEFQGLTNINPIEDIGISNIPFMEDLTDLSSMNPPGIDETLALLKVLEFIETEHDFDLIIFDTAPTGHTLRFLGLPETLSGWIGKILKMKMKLGTMFGAIKSMFGGESNKGDQSLEILERLNEAILRAKEDLTDPLKSSFVVVMISEEMAILETERLLNELVNYHIPNSNIIINQLYEANSELCEFCKARRRMQQKNLNKIKERFRKNWNKNLIEVPLFKDEIREYLPLKNLSNYLMKN
ncbi:MAG: TRC40/GET3/ArsA family transport-energizing ATPase [Candidatus Lokiarchaeota archaeon]|nr:TRC40/GET3/ArsA family transport-energizing ATPase [Candidatus Lokiarchaeota archaeon]